MATRILVLCKSHEMPGLDKEKNKLMANIACQRAWNRDFSDSQGDRLTCEGGYFLYNQRCVLLIDNGPVDAKDYSILWFKWRGKELVLIPGPIHPYILAQFRTRFQFNPADRPELPGYTDVEFKNKYGSERYQQLVNARNEKRDIARQFSSSSS